MDYRSGLLAKAVMAVVIGAVCWSAPAHAEKRVALVIGNGAYVNAPRLPNPKNDAEDVAAALKRTGFETIVGLDLDKAGMEDATIRFARAAREADVAIFYYSGHAMQFAGVNYLMPVDAKLTDEADLRRMARVDDIVADVQQAKNLRILVLDSCRDNPLAEQLKRSIGTTRSGGTAQGLAKIDSPQGMIVAYSTQAGRTAEDGQGRNSPYTAAFLKHIEETEEIGTVFRRVSTDVYERTKRAQLPELSLSLIGEFYLRGRPTFAAPPSADTTEPKSSAEQPVKQARLTEPADPFNRDLVTECDRLAASPTDVRRANGVAGVALKKIEVAPAMAACAEAMRQYPDVSRFVGQAGRVADAQKDHVTAHGLYKKAAAMGDPRGMVNLGITYDLGSGAAKDDAEARRWYEKAIAAGEPVAMQNLGNFYRDGRGMPQDYAEARRLYEKAAGLGNVQAMVNLGFMAYSGEGMAKDFVEARRWYTKAAVGGEVFGMMGIAGLYNEGLGGPKDQSEARRWFEKAAAEGNANAMYNVGIMYATGIGATKNFVEARRWLEKADEGGFEKAKSQLKLLPRQR